MNFFRRVGQSIARALRTPQAKALELALEQAAIARAVEIVSHAPIGDSTLAPAQRAFDDQANALAAQLVQHLTGAPAVKPAS